MKKGIIAVLALSTTLFMTSCGKKGGLSEETKTAMTTFETAWKAAEAQMTAFGTTMTATTGDMTKMMDDAMAMDMSKMTPAAKASCDSLIVMCGSIKTGIEGMKTAYTAGMDSWKADTQAYADWKKKGHDEKMDDATAMAGITEWNAKLATYTETMTGWNEQLTSMQGATKATCDAMMHLMPM